MLSLLTRTGGVRVLPTVARCWLSSGADRHPVPGVSKTIAVASGKGGVGKTTVSVNIAVSLAALGLKTGILDADVYGPNVPRMLGLRGRPEGTADKMMIPLENFNTKVMSMGFLAEPDAPIIWRGPMIVSALEQMLRQVQWGSLDVLIVDLPPGTGDAPLSIAQRVPLNGVVIVSTPQDVALLDARRGVNMFKRLDVPILGLVENMSSYVCPSCGHKDNIFGHGGAKRVAEDMEMEFLGDVPLHLDIRETSDIGTPISWAQPDAVHGSAFRKISARIRDKLFHDTMWSSHGPPSITTLD